MVAKTSDGSYTEINITDAVVFTFYSACPGTPTVYIDYETYQTVQIGEQCWLKKNLNVGTKINGTHQQTNNNIIEKYCYSDNDANCNTYGGLYQWAEAVKYHNGATNTSSPYLAFSGHVQGICPTGWHIPTDEEIMTLLQFVYWDANALKAIIPGSNGTNTSGFSMLLAGYHDLQGYYNFLGSYFCIWTSRETDATNAGYFFFSLDSTSAGGGINKHFGHSVRCLKD